MLADEAFAPTQVLNAGAQQIVPGTQVVDVSRENQQDNQVSSQAATDVDRHVAMAAGEHTQLGIQQLCMPCWAMLSCACMHINEWLYLKAWLLNAFVQQYVVDLDCVNLMHSWLHVVLN